MKNKDINILENLSNYMDSSYRDLNSMINLYKISKEYLKYKKIRKDKSIIHPNEVSCRLLKSFAQKLLPPSFSVRKRWDTINIHIPIQYKLLTTLSGGFQLRNLIFVDPTMTCIESPSFFVSYVKIYPIIELQFAPRFNSFNSFNLELTAKREEFLDKESEFLEMCHKVETLLSVSLSQNSFHAYGLPIRPQNYSDLIDLAEIINLGKAFWIDSLECLCLYFS